MLERGQREQRTAQTSSSSESAGSKSDQHRFSFRNVIATTGVRTEGTLRLFRLLTSSDGRTSLRPQLERLYADFTLPEANTMMALVWAKCSSVLAEASSAQDALSALQRSARLCEGAPGSDRWIALITACATLPDEKLRELCEQSAIEYNKLAAKFAEFAIASKRNAGGRPA